MPLSIQFTVHRIMDAEKLFLHSVLLILLFTFCTSMDSINKSETFKDGDLLISKGNKFALGFFSPGSSSYRYLGIWYYKVPKQTVVWVANRNNPINDLSGVVSFHRSCGDLSLYSGSSKEVPVWSTNVPVEVADTCVAQLLDSGNFVLVECRSRKVLWQSFDYPVNFLLPGMKLGLDKKTGIARFLTSWRSADDPGVGDYSLKLKPNGSPQYFIYKGTNSSWRTTPWPWIRQGLIHHTVFIDNQEEMYYSFTLPNDSVILTKMLDHSGILRTVIWHEMDGQLKEIWQTPQFRCDSYGICGAYSTCESADAFKFECACLPGYEPKEPRNWFLRDGSGGCVRKRIESSLVCGQGEGFVKVENVFLPDTSNAVRMQSMTLVDCEHECKKNCSCSAYSSIDVLGNISGCLIWYGELIDIAFNRERRSDLYVRVDALELADNARKSNGSFGGKTSTILEVAVASTWFVFGIFAYLWLRRRKRKGTLEENVLGENRTNPEVENFKFSTISAATNRFSPANKLGQGGFGSVYKGQLPNGQEIAVKRLSKNSGQGIEEFKNEVMMIAKLQHRNLVKLLGCCVQGGHQMLIYEYLPNKSLDSLLFDEKRKMMLDWRKRFNIIVGIARGILYLHQDSRLRIIHRDLKCSNILLDSEMNPKISDFGAARIFETDQIQERTRRVVGTFGYMSPEYAVFGKFSVKSDVFSFGVVLLEIISGKKNSRFDRQDPSSTLIGYVWELWLEDRALEIIDPSLQGLYHPREAKKCIQIGLLCVQEDANERPSMLAVVFMLNSAETAIPSPKQPAFVFREFHDNNKVAVEVEEEGCCFVDDTAITCIVGR